jgi:hypothetical protein
MKTVNVRDLRNSFSMLTAWRPDAPDQPAKPDFAARRRAIWGDRVFTEAEVAAMRADELEGEEG